MSVATSSLYNSESAWIVGIDLAWGDRRQDGLCLIHATRGGAKVLKTALTKGDAELFAWLDDHIPSSAGVLLAVDAPLVVPNATGSRPVDKQITLDFGRYHAGCYPANSTKCARSVQFAQQLQVKGYVIGYDLKTASRLVAEVYPHPAMIRLFDLEQIIKYKKGTVAVKKLEFKKLQNCLRKSLHKHMDEISPEIESLLSNEWSKKIEDQTDAIVCALIGYIHWKRQGILSKIVGSIEEGFILLPPHYRNGIILMEKRSDAVVTMELVNKLRDED